MRQGRKLLSVCAALAVLAAAESPLAHATPSGAHVVATAKSTKAKKSGSTAKSRRRMHQFTGVVIALDKSTITVEKGTKKPKTMVFTRHAEMKTTGDLEEDVRVTVYYREEDGKPVAHRVVVRRKAADSEAGR